MDHEKLSALLEAGLPEFRSVPFVDFEAKNDGWSFEGLAAVYDQQADLGDFTEEFMRGAFRKPLANGDNTRLMHEHSPAWVPVLATVRAKTMQLRDDVKGLVVKADIAKHYLGEAVRESIRRGDITGMSPGMIVGRGNSELQVRSAKPHRAIRALKSLPELSLTPDPVYSGTAAEMRSMWAFQMAESLAESQHPLMGAYQQLEGRATGREVDTDETKVEPEACEKCGSEPCVCESEQEQRAGVESAQSEAAARRRRLQMMGLSLPGGAR
jgi:HK97 family phage prohead protease